MALRIANDSTDRIGADWRGVTPESLRGKTLAAVQRTRVLRGNREVLTRRTIAIVGARNASSLGLRTARMLAGGLAEAGFLIVSGLARGVDTAAHQASVRAGTLAVLAGGVDVVYPSENAALMNAVIEAIKAVI